MFKKIFFTVLLTIISYPTVAENKKEIVTLPLQELQTFSEVYQHIQSNYHKKISDSDLIKSAIQGMLNRLDKNSVHYTKDEFSRFNIASNGEYANKIIASVSSQAIGAKTGYLSISQFTKQTPTEIQQQLEQLILENGIKKIIIDLRNNLGGVLTAGVDSVNLFLDKGIIYSSKGKASDSNRTIYANQNTPFNVIPMIIMVNKNSASSSEIFASALQENKRARVIGEQTYGKGTIQSVYALRDGSGIKLTTSEYFTAKGHQIEKKGVTPDILFNTENLSNELGQSIFDDLKIYQAFLQIQHQAN